MIFSPFVLYDVVRRSRYSDWPRGWITDKLRYYYRHGHENFATPEAYRLVLGANQPPI